MDPSPHDWTPRTTIAVYMNAGHTTNGNPRRGWLIVDPRSGDSIDFVDEGYKGEAGLKRYYPDALPTGRIDITPGQYRDFMKFAQEQAEKHKKGKL